MEKSIWNFAFFVFFEKAENTFFDGVLFSRFFMIFGDFWEAFWFSVGVLLESLASVWRVGVLLLVVCGLPESSVGSLCFFLW